MSIKVIIEGDSWEEVSGQLAGIPVGGVVLTTTEPEPETPAVTTEPELDIDGTPFDPELHTGKKTKRGAWCKKSVRKPKEPAPTPQETVSPTQTGTNVAGGGAPAPVVGDGGHLDVSDDDGVAEVNPMAATTPAPVNPAPTPEGEPITFGNLMKMMITATTKNVTTQEQVDGVTQSLGIGIKTPAEVGTLPNKDELIPVLYNAIAPLCQG